MTYGGSPLVPYEDGGRPSWLMPEPPERRGLTFGTAAALVPPIVYNPAGAGQVNPFAATGLELVQFIMVLFILVLLIAVVAYLAGTRGVRKS